MKYSALKIVSLFGLSLAAGTSVQADFSLSVFGGYTFENAPQGHQHFSTNVLAYAPESDSQDGVWGGAELRYRWANQFAGFSVQGINIDTGAPYDDAPETVPEMGVDGRIYDLEYGREFQMGAGMAYWSAGLRHASFDMETDNFSVGSGPLHEFRGTGVRVGIETETPMQRSGWSWFSDGGLSILDGEIESSSRGGWISTDATDTSTTAVALDAKIGLNYNAGGNATWVFGYQLQYWSDVNVAISDDTGFGGNVGTSDLLFHGPFVGLQMDF